MRTEDLTILRVQWWAFGRQSDSVEAVVREADMSQPSMRYACAERYYKLFFWGFWRVIALTSVFGLRMLFGLLC